MFMENEEYVFMEKNMDHAEMIYCFLTMERPLHRPHSEIFEGNIVVISGSLKHK